MSARARKPLRITLPGVIDVVIVSDPEQLAWLDRQPEIERRLNPAASWLHARIERRLRVDLGFVGRLLPVFRSRSDSERAAQQRALTARLDSLADAPGPERDALTRFVREAHASSDPGVLAQHWCGRLFRPHYACDRESYEAGRRLARWPSAPPWRTFAARRHGRLLRDKQRVAARVDNDPHAIHATTIAMEHVARTLTKLRAAAHDPRLRGLDADAALRACLVTPVAVLRSCGATLRAPFLTRPLTPRSLIVLWVARAFSTSGDLDVAFAVGRWSACPARRLVPAMLRAVWQAARSEASRPASAAGQEDKRHRVVAAS